MQLTDRQAQDGGNGREYRQQVCSFHTRQQHAANESANHRTTPVVGHQFAAVSMGTPSMSL
jgi:hypothetical protein